MMNIENKLPDPILVTGCARSGTSMVAGAIHLCGAFGGNMSGPNKNNQKGMFENSEIRNNITKPYLRDLGLDPLGQYPLPNINDLMIPIDWRRKVEQVFLKQGYDGKQKIFYKGAKMCLFWPVWHYAFPNAKWIIVRRRTGDIVESCCRVGFMRAFRIKENQKAVGVDDEREGWIWWVNQHLERFREMIDTGLNVKIVWPQRMVLGDYQQLYETIEWLGLKWNSEVLNFVDPKLWKSRSGNLFTTEPMVNKIGPPRVKTPIPEKKEVGDWWWRKDHWTKPLPTEQEKAVCAVCSKFGWWSKTDRKYLCAEHRSD